MILAAAKLGCRTLLLCRSAQEPAASVTDRLEIGDWNDPAVLLAFARQADALVLEHELVDASTLAAVEQAGVAVCPSAATLELVQDKLRQRETLAAAGLPGPGFRRLDRPDDVSAAAADLGWPLMLKRRRGGYDGKGNALARTAADVVEAWGRLGGGPGTLYAEAFCGFERELAVIVCRDRSGRCVTYPVVESVQQGHVCTTVIMPAPIPAAVAEQAAELARSAVAAVRGHGTFGVELFLRPGGSLAVNELAPRVHNTGHYTIEACACSQFENQVRAALGWPMGKADALAPAAAMVNLLGRGPGPGYPAGVPDALAVPGAHVHVYGKAASGAGRKMGHVTALGASAAEALATARKAASHLQFGGKS
jgi:5-(carboxyamino)imidazole ribonucleotide synthase